MVFSEGLRLWTFEECYKSKVQKQAIYEGEVTESNQAFLQAELPLETHK